jgi:hypothetical protein
MENKPNLNNRIYQFDFISFCQKMSQEGNNSEEITVDNFTELGQLIRSTLQTVDELFPPKPEFSFEDMMVQFYTLKSKIKKIDPSWKFENTDISYVFEILKLLDAVNVEEIPDLQQNAKVCQRLLHRVRIMRQVNPSWSLDVESIMKFLYPTLSIQPREEQTPRGEQIQF